jgi:hypothetical protein
MQRERDRHVESSVELLLFNPVPGDLLFRVTTGHVTLLRPNARLKRPYVHPLNIADFKGIRAG